MKDYSQHRLTICLNEPSDPAPWDDSEPDGKLYTRAQTGAVRITWGQIENLPADVLGNLIQMHFKSHIKWLRFKDGETSFEEFTAELDNN